MNEIEALLQRITLALQGLPGIEAIVLGGSRARGVHRPDSDVDIGIYYDAARLDLAALEAVAQHLNDDTQERVVYGPGEWGLWVNGGAWLVVDGQRVDLILRDIERVRGVIDDAQRGVFSTNYQPGHPHAFISVTYMGELAISRLLWESSSAVSALQEVARVYPPALKRALIGAFGFEACFSCALAKTYASKDESYYVVAHLVRSVSCLNQVLFALNEQYCLNEKGAIALVSGFAIVPEEYRRRVDRIFMLAAANLVDACKELNALVGEVETLALESEP